MTRLNRSSSADQRPAIDSVLPNLLRFGLVVRALMTLAILCLTTGADAQQPGASPANAAPVRSMTFEWVIVVFMIGVALFTICRSSRRN